MSFDDSSLTLLSCCHIQAFFLLVIIETLLITDHQLITDLIYILCQMSVRGWTKLPFGIRISKKQQRLQVIKLTIIVLIPDFGMTSFIKRYRVASMNRFLLLNNWSFRLLRDVTYVNLVIDHSYVTIPPFETNIDNTNFRWIQLLIYKYIVHLMHA